MTKLSCLSLMTLALIAGLGAVPCELHAKEAPGAAAKKRVLYQCPMHPQIVREHPGECPICHMDLQKVEMDESEAPSQPKPVSATATHADFTLSQERQQIIGVRVAKAAKHPLRRVLRLSARVAGSNVLAQLSELDAGSLRSGQSAQILGANGEAVNARVLEVDGGIDPLTRSFAVLLAPLARAAWMRHGVLCEARVQLDLGRRLTVPQEAVLDSGERQVVFVRGAGGRFQARDVVLGERGDEMIEIKRGVKEGEEVVVSANFLIDSEARFKAALQRYQ